MPITTLGMVEDTKLPGDVVQSGLFHDLYDRTDGLNKRLQALERSIEAQREMVREWRTDIAERRVA